MHIMDKLSYLIQELKREGIKDNNVLNSLLKIKRELFIQEKLKDLEYENYPLDIGNNQTISQPYTTAFMLQLLELKKGDKVLEIGTGSGWSTALTAQIINPGKIYSIESIEDLSKFAKENIKKVKLKNIKIITGNGDKGLKEHSPYDKIIVNAACSKLPSILMKQLKDKGILLAPIGSLYGQKMIRLIKDKDKDKDKTEDFGDFVFVPLISDEYGF